MDNEKSYTLKSVQSAIKKLEKSRENKQRKMQELTQSIKADCKQIKELESVYEKLYYEDLQRQISEAWFKENKLTGKQVMKYLEISRQVSDKIDKLDVNAVVQAILQQCSQQDAKREPAALHAKSDQSKS